MTQPTKAQIEVKLAALEERILSKGLHFAEKPPRSKVFRELFKWTRTNPNRAEAKEALGFIAAYLPYAPLGVATVIAEQIDQFPGQLIPMTRTLLEKVAGEEPREEADCQGTRQLKYGVRNALARQLHLYQPAQREPLVASLTRKYLTHEVEVRTTYIGNVYECVVDGIMRCPQNEQQPLLRKIYDTIPAARWDYQRDFRVIVDGYKKRKLEAEARLARKPSIPGKQGTDGQRRRLRSGAPDAVIGG